MSRKPWVLCVDDEPRVLDAIEQNLAFDYDIRTATSGAEALELLAAEPGCGVVVSDMRMPVMNGAELLARVRELHPRTTRVLLTGQASLDAAIEAINHGGIFRFLIKPCPIEVLSSVIAESLEQHRLVTSEHDLLKNTLRGALQILVDVLGVTAPLAFNRAELIRKALLYAGERLRVPIGWEGELAALLSRLGWISIPSETLERYVAGEAMTEDGVRMFAASKRLASRLIRPVPRLGDVASLIDAIGTIAPGVNPHEMSPQAATALLLSVALELDRRAMRGDSWDVSVRQLSESIGTWVATGFLGFDPYADRHGASSSLEVRAAELTVKMVVEETVRMKNGTKVLPEGTTITPLLLARLKNFAQGAGLVEPIRVRIPGMAPKLAPVLPAVPTYAGKRPSPHALPSDGTGDGR